MDYQFLFPALAKKQQNNKKTDDVRDLHDSLLVPNRGIQQIKVYYLCVSMECEMEMRIKML